MPSGVDVDAIVEEIRFGSKGYVIVPGVFSAEEMAEARKTAHELLKSEGELMGEVNSY